MTFLARPLFVHGGCSLTANMLQKVSHIIIQAPPLPIDKDCDQARTCSPLFRLRCTYVLPYTEDDQGAGLYSETAHLTGTLWFYVLGMPSGQ